MRDLVEAEPFSYLSASTAVMSNVSSRAQGWSDSWLPSGVRHAAGGKEVALSLAYMVLMVFGDLLASSATLTMMQDLVPVEAGQWNFATAKFIATTATDMLGQLLVGYLADRYGRRFAMTANAFSFGLSTLWTALMSMSLLNKDVSFTDDNSGFLRLAISRLRRRTSAATSGWRCTDRHISRPGTIGR